MEVLEQALIRNRNLDVIPGVGIEHGLNLLAEVGFSPGFHGCEARLGGCAAFFPLHGFKWI